MPAREWLDSDNEWLLRCKRLDCDNRLFLRTTMENWTDTFHCESREHCDACPYVLERKAGFTKHMLVLRHDDGAGIEDVYAPPENSICPFGITHAMGQRARGLLLVERVTKGIITAEAAIAVAEKLGIDLEAELTSL